MDKQLKMSNTVIYLMHISIFELSNKFIGTYFHHKDFAAGDIWVRMLPIVIYFFANRLMYIVNNIFVPTEINKFRFTFKFC